MDKYEITGMSCAACQARVEKVVSGLAGVESCTVNLLTNSMMVEGDAAPEEIIKTVEKAGYGALKSSDAKKENGRNIAPTIDTLSDKETPALKRRLCISAVLLAVLMYLSMGTMLFAWPVPAMLEGNHIAMGLLQLLLSTAIMVINQKFFISGFRSLIGGAPNMDTLVAIGSISSYVYSVYALFGMTSAAMSGDANRVMELMDEFYFESAATILTLITVGKTLESISKGRTTDAIKSLIKLAPQTATVEIDGREVSLDISRVEKGSIIILRPGERIPVDGIITEGFTSVDESALTGESIPVDKKVGDKISAGTINASGFVKCRAVEVGEDTSLSKIIRLVSDASASKAPIAKVADKVSGVFVPVVIVIALLTFVIWLLAGETTGFALSRAISVLVISCPCALGLATPVAIMVGNGVGARNGILFKTAESLEQTGRTRVLALDKTGTITKGAPEVTDIVAMPGVDEEELLKFAYSLENMSEHPLAKAVCSFAKSNNIGPEDMNSFRNFPGNGIKAMSGDSVILGGNLSFFEEEGINYPDRSMEMAKRLSGEGKTPLYFAKDNSLLGIIAVADKIKDDSPQAIKELKKLGIKTFMLTGDNVNTASVIGRQCGVENVMADVLPDGKADSITGLKQEGITAMVGDGINDAPALTVADVGIAIGAGTDIAIESADVVLMKNSLLDVVSAIRLSQKTLKNIHENLFWAFFYNVIGIPLAAGLYYPIWGLKLNPMFAAAAMSLSSFCVVSNALRLNFVKLKQSGDVNTVNRNSNEIKDTISHSLNEAKDTINCNSNETDM